ncbi:MAG: hypothetical protein LBD82_02005, partial [Deltaproteobacteria bacterium]|nr:hypothetical protein [Deltaproteobacteria bacterium]
MKHVLTLLVAVVLAAGTAARAEAAVQLGATGNLDAVAVLTDAYAEKNEKEDTLDLRSRLRATFSAEANQYIKGYWEFQVGEWCWGHPNGTDNPGPMDTNIQDFKTRLSWIEAKFPNTPLSMSAGLIQLTLPNAVGGNPLYDARTAGAALSADLGGGITLTGFYGRPAQNNGAATSNPNTNSADMFGLIVSVEKGTLKAEPYFTYAKVGHSSGVPLPWADGLSNDGKYTALTGAGLALTADFKPVVLKLDAIYARADNKTENAFDTKGYHIALAADYKAKFGTPGLIAWYSSGADKEGKGVLPVLGVDGGVVYTRMFTYGTASLGDEGFGSGTAVGSMGLGL